MAGTFTSRCREALTRAEVVPRARRQRDFDLTASGDDRRHQQRIAAKELCLVTAREGIGGKRQRHRAHDRQSRFDSLRDD